MFDLSYRTHIFPAYLYCSALFIPGIVEEVVVTLLYAAPWPNSTWPNDITRNCNGSQSEEKNVSKHIIVDDKKIMI